MENEDCILCLSKFNENSMKIQYARLVSFFLFYLACHITYAQNSNCVGNCINGYGIMMYVNGDIYDGNWQSGLRHGEGEYIFDNGDIMSGYWLRGSCRSCARESGYNSNTQETSNASNKNQSNNIRVRISKIPSEIYKVAVIGKEASLCNGEIDDGQELAELVEGELLGIYGVVERKYLNSILEEQILAMSGLVLDDNDFANAGCLAGAQGTVIASYGCLQDKTKLQVKLVDCSTSDLYWSVTGFNVSEFELLDALRERLD